MNISDIQKNYPNKKYYKLRKCPNKSMLEIEKIADFFELTNLVGYFESQISGKDASDSILDSIIEAYLVSVYSWIDTRNPIYKDFVAYVNEHISNKLRYIVRADTYTITNLYGIGIDIMYEDEASGSMISEEEFKEGMAEVSKIFTMYNEERERKQEMRQNEIEKCILRFKNEYLQLKTKTDKEEFIKKVQVELKKIFDADGRSDYRFTKAFNKKMYEEK